MTDPKPPKNPPQEFLTAFTDSLRILLQQARGKGVVLLLTAVDVETGEQISQICSGNRLTQEQIALRALHTARQANGRSGLAGHELERELNLALLQQIGVETEPDGDDRPH